MIRLALAMSVCLVGCAPADAPLASSSDIVADGIPRALTEAPSDPIRGMQVFVGRDQGHCVLCHIVSDLDVEFQGNVGPDLTYVADRLTPSQLRLRVVDYQIVRPGTLMPSYYRIHDLYQVGREYQDEPVLSAQDIEDVVAYLATLPTKTDED